jgi:alanine-glyoxylate transaminase/serine-glyoxylate transaminase/serine-pyruvate transaminase
MAGAIWRIGLMGYSCRAENVRTCLRAIGQALQGQGLDVDPEAALTAAGDQLSAQQTASA